MDDDLYQKIVRNRVRYGAAFTSAARALQYAATEMDVQYIYILPVSQCQIVDQMAPRTTIPETLTRAIGIGAVLVHTGSIPTDHSLTHTPPAAHLEHAPTGSRD